MSVYNGEQFIAEAIECILAQTYRDFEFIIINDGSSDASLAIMQEYAARDDRIHIIDQDNTGLTVALRRGIDAAKGEYIARMDVDDISLPRRFEKQMALLEARPELVAVTTDVQHYSENGPRPEISALKRDPRLLPLLLCFANELGGHGQVIFRRDAYQAAGGYNPEFRYSQDYDLWTRLAKQGLFGSVREVLYHWLCGHGNISSRFSSAQAACSQSIQRRQYRRIIGSDMRETTAQALWLFSRRAAPERTSMLETWRVTSAMLRGIRVFFKANPELAHEKFESLRFFAAVWWWRLKQFSQPRPFLRLAYLACIARLGLAALLALAVHGKSGFGQAEKA
jgi:glycosyltransferase involved in cell wall biosynthesis